MEIIEQILFKLSPQDLAKASRVWKKWREVANGILVNNKMRQERAILCE